MADLEEHAIQRDKRFLLRLFASLVIGGAAALWGASHLTSGSTGGCVASLFGASAPPVAPAGP
jgi:hypothetical protein